MTSDEKADRVTADNLGKYLALCERSSTHDTHSNGTPGEPIDMRGLFGDRSD